ncbi:MAG TPA: hypothetical protein PLY70_00090 [Saprospiraceae bacterium]|nr:hypothetical protein [Saprospiraceae bacterium]HPN67896.1 hypothetical protein [Saprospiraceae bacterium]
MIYKEFSFGGKNNPLGSFGAIIAMIAVLLLLFFIAKGVFTILSFIAPVLLILALFFDYTVVTDYLKFIGQLFKEKPLFGVLASILTVVGYPVVFGFLFFRAFARKSLKSAIKKAEEAQRPKYSEYEEVKDEEEFLTLPNVEKESVKSKKNDNDYEDLFK